MVRLRRKLKLARGIGSKGLWWGLSSSRQGLAENVAFKQRLEDVGEQVGGDV